MAALVTTLSRAFGTDLSVETLKIIAIFCGVGLLVSLMVASYGVDLTPAFSDVEMWPAARFTETPTGADLRMRAIRRRGPPCRPGGLSRQARLDVSQRAFPLPVFANSPPAGPVGL